LRLLIITYIVLHFTICGVGQTGIYGSAKRYGELGMEELVSTALELYDNEQDIAEFFYYWVATHIQYDRAGSSGRQPYVASKEALIEDVMNSRNAVCSGYAQLYCELLSRCNIPCETINGISKTRENLLQGIPYSEDHTWNAVNIFDRWYLLDVTWANTTSRDGFIDDFYFMTEPGIFILDHFPSEIRWQMLSDPVTLSEFKQYPCFTKKYFQLGFGGYIGKITEANRNGTYQLRLGVSERWEPIPVIVNKHDVRDKRINYTITPGSFKYYQTLGFSSKKSIVRIDAVRKEKNYTITEFGVVYFDLSQVVDSEE
jgi:transglutaminase/protease-like cytokinesis protein 3